VWQTKGGRQTAAAFLTFAFCLLPFALSLLDVSRPRASRTIENVIRRLGFVHVAGVDEVGRGCLAGPVVAAAVVLQPDHYVPGIADSKVLSPQDREGLFDPIVNACVSWAVAILDAAEIDRINIHRASLAAMRQAVTSLAPLPGFVLVDGFRIPDLLMPQRHVVGGDRRSTAIAAASILAKVTRDRLMLDLHAQDPRYGFDRHKGYATRDHLDAVAKFGYSAVHRRSFRPPSLFDTLHSHES
jgi:ribonuclease HII